MKIDCPHCGARFDVADERALEDGATAPCPECLETCAISGAGSDPFGSGEFDLGFDLSGVASDAAGTNAPVAPPGDGIPTDPGGGSGAGFALGGESSLELSDFSFEDSRAAEKSSAFGFDVAPDEQTGEVSALQDVDLTMVGTYHRTGRKLHHATDVVWTGKRGVEPEASTPGPIPEAARSSSPPRIPKDDPPSHRPSRPASRPPEPEASLSGHDGFTGVEASVLGGSDGLSDFESLPPSMPLEDVSLSEGFSEIGASNEPEPSRGSKAGDFSVAGTAQSGGMEEMDFSSLLEDSMSAKSIFGDDQNPFVDVGITSDSVAGLGDLSDFEPSAAPMGEGSKALFESSDDTNTFFIEAPSVGGSAEPSSAPVEASTGALDVSGAFDVDMPSQAGGPPSRDPAPAAAGGGGKKGKKGKKAGRGGKNRKSGSSKGPIVALLLLLVVGGAGVAGEMLGHGWFFMNMLDPPPATSTARGGGPARAAGPAAKPGEKPAGTATTPAEQPVAAQPRDTAAAYEERMGELRGVIAKAKKSEDEAAKKAAAQAASELTVALLQYRYRWPGRLDRDDARKAELAALVGDGASLGLEAQFWDLMSREPKEGETREDLQRKAELALAQVDPKTLGAGRHLLFKGLLFKEQKRPENALTVVELALGEAPEDAWALYEKADLLHRARKLDDAAATIDALHRVEPGHLEASLLAARVAIARQTPDAYEKAEELVTAALEKAGKDEDSFGAYKANLMLAVVYGLQNDLQKRLEALEAAATFDPRDETLLLELAENDLKSGNNDRAIERLKSCAEGVCKSLKYYKTHIRVLYATHKWPEAEKLASESLKVHPDSADLLFWYGQVLERRGKLRLAAKRYEAVKAKDPRYLEAYLLLAGIHRREKEFDQAIRVLDEASKVFEGAGSDSEAAMALMQERGELLIKQARLDKAREVFKKIVSAQPTNAPARLSLAKLLTEVGYPEEAVQHFEKLYEQGKSGPEINVTFAEALIRSGKPDRAIEELKAFLEHNPKNLEALVKLGHAYVQKQRYEEAMAVLEHAVAINRNYAQAYYFAGLAELGRQRQRAEEVERKRRAGEPIIEDERPDFRKAIVALSTAKDKDPENLEYRQTLAEALTEAGGKRNILAALEQYDNIVSAYTKARRVGRTITRSAEVYFRRGLLSSKLGRPRAEVLKDFQEALLLDSQRADFIARYAEELYRMQSKTKVGDRFVLEAKAYFKLVQDQHNANHVRSNYYMGKITLREWDKQTNKRPGDELHKVALEYFQRVARHNGQEQFPDALMQIGNILRDRQMYRLATQYYEKYLATYQRVRRTAPPNERYVRELIRATK